MPLAETPLAETPLAETPGTRLFGTKLFGSAWPIVPGSYVVSDERRF
ncbi:MAG: hypothetical protein GY719_00530 [bacterium]|nr:hypothetical protein [bacterium]